MKSSNATACTAPRLREGIPGGHPMGAGSGLRRWLDIQPHGGEGPVAPNPDLFKGCRR